jgi:hypothetical protein
MTKDLDQKIIELMDLFDDEQVTTADKIDRPQQALDREAYSNFMKRNPMAGGGMLVQPGFGGVRQGYRESKPETITKISDFIENFKLEKERLPSKNEIKVGLKIDSNTVANAVEQGKLDILPEKEAKILGQSKILKKRQELTLGKGKKPYVSVKEKGKGGKEVLWESEAQKNQYINDLKKRFEGTGFRPQAYDAPTNYLTNKQLAIKYFGSDSDANVQRIKNINTELRKTENLKYIEVGDDEKKGGKDRRLERERSGTALLSDREKRINLAQDEYVKSLNNFFKQNPNKIKNYPKLIELINLSFDPKTGTIGSKNKTLDELKKYITSEGGLFDIEHISDLQYEKKNRQFPVNRQIAPQNVNKGFLSSVTAYIKNNKDNPQAQTQIKNIENTLKKYGLRIYVPETGTFGANMIGAYDQTNKSFPNFDRIINNLNVKSPNFKFKEIPKIDIRVPPSGSAPTFGSLDIPSIFRKLSPATRKLVGFGGGTVLPEVLFYQLDKANRMSKGVSEKEAAAGALESGTLGAYTNKAYMEELKKVAESMNIDSGAFDSAYNLNVLSKSFEQNSKNVDAQIATALENQDVKTAEELRKNFNKYLARIKPEAERLRNDIEERVTGGSPLTMSKGRGNVTDKQYSKPFYDMQDVALEKLKKEKQKVFDTQKRQVDTAAGNIGEGFYQAFDTLTQGAKNLLKGRIIPFGPDRLRPLESEREKEARYLKEMDPRELFLYNKARGFTYDNPITEADLSNLQYEQPGLFSKGGRAGFKLGTIRKGVLSLIDESVKKTPTDITPDLDALIKKTLDEDFFDKKDRIIDNINAKISRARAKGLDSEEIGEGQIEFYDDITKSNFRTKTGPFFDRRKRAGGGILKQAGDSSGPPPESGPMSEGLQGLMKRGIKT